jgi:uncharacterized protein YkwD
VPRTTIVIRSFLLAVGTVVLVSGCEGRDTVGAGGGGAGFVTQLPSTVVTEPSTAALVGDPSSSAASSSSAAPSSSSAESSVPTTTTTTTTTTTSETSTVAAPPPNTPEKPADPPPVNNNPAPTESQASEAKVLEITNKERAANGCGALVFDERLANAARGHSADMAAQNYFDHKSKDGRSFVDRIKVAGYPSPGAENIAAGQPTPEAVMKGWMESPGHRANILNCGLKALGVGVAKGGSFGIYWTQNFGW